MERIKQGQEIGVDKMPEGLSPITKAWHEAFGGHHTLVALKSHAVPIVLCIVFWQLYTHALASLACHFRDDSRLLSLWPANLVYVDQLAGSSFSPPEICWLFAVTSTTSAIWLCWLVWRIGFEVFRTDVVFVPGGTTVLLQRCGGMLVLFAFILLFEFLISLQGFAPDSRVYGLTLKAGIGSNAFKIAFLFEGFFFLTLGLTVEVAGLFVRYLFFAVRHSGPN